MVLPPKRFFSFSFAPASPLVDAVYLQDSIKSDFTDLLEAMVIHFDAGETIFNAFQIQFEVWMLISDFFEVRESFIRVRGNFVLLRAFIVRHSCYPPRRATKPRLAIPCFEVVLKVYSWN
jgi:hypothetical protein